MVVMLSGRLILSSSCMVGGRDGRNCEEKFAISGNESVDGWKDEGILERKKANKDLIKLVMQNRSAI